MKMKHAIITAMFLKIKRQYDNGEISQKRFVLLGNVCLAVVHQINRESKANLLHDGVKIYSND